MSNISSKALTSFKYVYLAIFFALLSGFFHPLITNTSFDIVVIGSLVLAVGLAGGISLWIKRRKLEKESAEKESLQQDVSEEI